MGTLSEALTELNRIGTQETPPAAEELLRVAQRHGARVSEREAAVNGPWQLFNLVSLRLCQKAGEAT